MSIRRPVRPALLGLCLVLIAAGPAPGPPAQGQHEEPRQQQERERQEEEARPPLDPAAVVPADGPVRSIGVAGALRVALDHSPLARATRLDADRARLDVEEVTSFWSVSQFGLGADAGIVPAARGDIFQSIDSSNDLNDLGPFYKFEIGAVFPIYTFGRLSHAADAARGKLSAEESQGRRSRDELGLEVVKAYWGLRAAQESLDVFGGMVERYYDELLPEIEEKLEDIDIDPNDAYEVRAARYDIDKTWLDAVEQHRVVRRALAEFLGERPETRFELTDPDPPAILLQEEDLPRLREIAARHNPQLRALRSATGALQEAMELERAERFPVFLLGGGFSLAQAPGRDDQDNPFVWDDFNYRRIGAAFDVKWDLNFAQHRIDYLKRRFERDATAARAEALEQKIGIDVHRALERVLKWRRLLESARETRETTRRWLRTAFDDFDLGLGEAEPLIDAYRADYRLQGLVIESQYQLNISLAELAFAMGDFHTYLQWIAHGQASLE